MPEAEALWFEGPGRAGIRPEHVPCPSGRWCLVESVASLVSAGTERLVLRGLVPPELFAEMACPYMGGAFPFPVKYGYSLVGRVVEGPAELLDRMVHVLHPHQTLCHVRAEDAFPVPAGVTPERAVLASNLETAVTAVWDSRVSIGDRALVVGFGTVGALVAGLLSLVPGIDPEVAEPVPERRAIAEAMGLQARSPEEVSGGFDVAFQASGSAAGLDLALERVGFEGTVIDLSWYGSDKVPVGLGRSFHSQRKDLRSSQVSHIPAGRRARWDMRRRKGLVFELLRRPAFDALVTRRVPFADLPAFYEGLAAGEVAGLGALVEYGPRV